MPVRDLTVVLVGSYPPRRCGVATFTADLGRALTLQSDIHVYIIAIEPQGEAFLYGRNVIGRIQENGQEGYLDAVKHVYRYRADIVCVQHEFGLWGVWSSGDLELDYSVPFIRALSEGPRRIPVVTTLHTIRPNPPHGEREALRGIVMHSAASVVMARIGAMILIEDYGLPSDTIVHIPHGVPVVEQRPRRYFKRQLGLEGRTIISTLGLLDPRKGIEYAIAAMPAVIERHPEALYLIVGETHPEYRKRFGEQYRNELRVLVHELGLRDHVRFVNQFLSDREVVDYLQASDIYVTPYLDRNQITSGTLAFAVGTGKAIISTPYVHATEALAEGRGLLAEFRSAESLAHCMLLMLDNPEYRHLCERLTAEYGKQDAWPLVGARYAELFRRIVAGEPFTDMLAVKAPTIIAEAASTESTEVGIGTTNIAER
jgi:glycosyltransferase involved in cell wall biosynthesis